MAYKKLLGAFLVSAAFPVLASAQETAPHPTYANEVSRIIQENCQECHQPGSIGPMSFTSYEEVRPWAPLIQLKVANREMPPYQYDTDIGIQDLQNDWRMSQEDIDTIVDWVNAGSPFGSQEDLPAPKDFPALDSVWPLNSDHPTILLNPKPGMFPLKVRTCGGNLLLIPASPKAAA